MFDISIGAKTFVFDTGSKGAIYLTKDTARQIGLSNKPKPIHLQVELLGVGDITLPTGVVVSRGLIGPYTIHISNQLSSVKEVIVL
jgi:hypothetical protein